MDQSAIEVKLEFICREIKELKDEQKKIKEDLNKGKGAVWILIFLAGIVTAILQYFNQS
jgi:hypothetical protein|tara:strand:+ start:191 stop:367 length:177 start_codon:yes stop_codon:yes gene_type:complete